MPRILAVDYGERRVGLALSDERAIIASAPLPTIDRKSLKGPAALEREIARLVVEHEVGEMVVGLPVNMDGSHGEAAQKAEQFARDLETVTGLKVATWDERLTTVVARRVQVELNLPRAKRQDKSRLDRTAALLLLQNYLDYRGRSVRPEEDPAEDTNGE